ncbi:MAG: hypothetical protein P4L46_08610 [Fimbriimonas sp.]|nr:hypothetical protein [Fimbriimonas sp.]
MGQNYLDNGWISILITLAMVFMVLLNIMRAHNVKDLFIRRIAGLNAIDEAVGRATEMGRPVLMVPGLTDTTVNAKTMQAINIFAYVSRVAARFANPILVCCYNASTYTIAQEIIRDVYQQEGLIDRYDVDSVRFISDRQFAFAAGVAGLILREKAAATFFMGEFYAESLILAETANSVGAIQVASSTEMTQTPFFIAACDYVLIGDEFYAASAFLTRHPVLVGSLIGQDWCKLAIAGLIAIGVAANSFQLAGGSHNTTSKAWNEGKFDTLPKPKPFGAGDTTLSRWLNPDPAKDIKIERPQLPPDQIPSGGGN